jgi:hypothetical protein
VGSNGRVLNYAGGDWAVGTGIVTSEAQFYAIDGSSASDVVVVGKGPEPRVGIITNFDGSRWTSPNLVTSYQLRDLWGTSAEDLFAVGERGVILHRSAAGWSEMTKPPVANPFYNGVSGTSSSNVLAVGSKGSSNLGLIVRYDGSDWTEMNAPALTPTLSDVWAVRDDTAFAVGQLGTILIMEGSSWSAMASPTGDYLEAVWGWSPTAVYVASYGAVYVYDGTQWSSVVFNPQPGGYTTLHGHAASESGVNHVVYAGELDGTVGRYHSKDDTYIKWEAALDVSVRDVWGYPSDPWVVYAVGSEGTSSRYDVGTIKWRETDAPTGEWLHGVWGTTGGEVFAVGGKGVIITRTDEILSNQ